MGLKFDPDIRELLHAVPELPNERETKDEIYAACVQYRSLLERVRTILLDISANSLLYIGESADAIVRQSKGS